MSIPGIIVQLLISIAVVVVYHVLISRKAPSQTTQAPAPPPMVPAPIIAPPKPPAPISAPAPSAPEQLAPELVAVIASAVAVVLGRPHRVLSVEQTDTVGPQVNVWALEGRLGQFMSHKVR